jgi:16S rRNA (guanine527-N7)-methyltransferase
MSEAERLIRDGVRALGLQLTEKQINAFFTYLEELKKWNKAYNLTGLKTDRDIIIKHFLDSLLFAKVITDDAEKVADVGSGAGFPGIPIKIIKPELELFLIEPRQKKTVFLRHLSGRLGLKSINVIDRRIEDVKNLKVDVAVTRALFSVRDFIVKTRDLLNKEGLLILSKGPKIDRELRELDRKKVTVKDFNLPFINATRHIVIVKH